MKLKYFLNGLHLLCFASLLALTVSCSNTHKRHFYSVGEEELQVQEEEPASGHTSEQPPAQPPAQLPAQLPAPLPAQLPTPLPVQAPAQAIYGTETFVAPRIDSTESQERVIGLRKIDFLFVVDNSSSMKSNQNELKKEFQSLYDSFKMDELDFRLAVVTTDAYRSNTPDFYAAQGNDKILTQNTTDLKRQFMENVSVGEDGYDAERGVDSAIAVLK